MFMKHSRLVLRQRNEIEKGDREDAADDLYTIVVWWVFGKSYCSYQACLHWDFLTLWILTQ